MVTIALAEPAPLVTLQDAGRQGAMRFGVSQSGPMDWVRFRQARALTGAPSAVFEVGLAGARFRADGTVALAVTGPAVSVTLGGARLTGPVALTLAAGGLWAYVAVRGLDPGPPVLGSHATNVRTGLGARDLTKPMPAADAAPAPPRLYADVDLGTGPIPVTAGPQLHLFPEATKAALTGAPFTVTERVDRMGYQLAGPKLRAERHDIVSDGIVEGAMQVPSSGNPIVLMADRAPTGGYPKIAVVSAAGRARLCQTRPGETVRFRLVSVDEARRLRHALTAAADAPKPRDRAVDPKVLAAENLVDGVWAHTPGSSHEDQRDR